VKQADGYESTLTQESQHFYLGKSQADQVERPDEFQKDQHEELIHMANRSE